MKITGTGSILLDGRATGYVLVQHGTNTVVFHQRFGTALALPSAHYDLSGRPGSPKFDTSDLNSRGCTIRGYRNQQVE